MTTPTEIEINNTPLLLSDLEAFSYELPVTNTEVAIGMVRQSIYNRLCEVQDQEKRERRVHPFKTALEAIRDYVDAIGIPPPDDAMREIAAKALRGEQD